jgi:hypothetical protein
LVSVNGTRKVVGSWLPASWAANVSAFHSHSTGSTTMPGFAWLNAAAWALTASMVGCLSPGRQPSTLMVTFSPPVDESEDPFDELHAATADTDAMAMTAATPRNRAEFISNAPLRWVLLGESCWCRTVFVTSEICRQAGFTV